MFPDECSQSTLVLPSSAPNDGALVCLRVTNDWTKILLDLSAVLQDERLWVEGTDLDTAYVFAQQLEQIIVRAVEDCNMAVIPIGTISMFAATAPPEKWLVCEGQAISRETYAELFAVIGEAYGSGDFSTTFNVPNFIDRSPMGTGGDFTGFPGATSGAHEITLTEFQMPSHNHAISDPGHVHAPLSPNTTFLGNRAGATNTAPAGSGIGTATTTASATTGIGIGATGGGLPHANVHPVLGATFLIYTGVP